MAFSFRFFCIFLFVSFTIISFFLDQMTNNGAYEHNKPLECATHDSGHTVELLRIDWKPKRSECESEEISMGLELWNIHVAIRNLTRVLSNSNHERVSEWVSVCVCIESYFIHLSWVVSIVWRRNTFLHTHTMIDWTEFMWKISLGNWMSSSICSRTCVFYAFSHRLCVCVRGKRKHMNPNNACVWRRVFSCQIVFGDIFLFGSASLTTHSLSLFINRMCWIMLLYPKMNFNMFHDVSATKISPNMKHTWENPKS